MANTIVREYSKLTKVDIVGDYIVRAWREVYGVFANGAEVKIGEMCSLLTPGTDLSGEGYNPDDPEMDDFRWYCVDEVRKVAEAQWDEESVAEWNSMEDDEKEDYLE